MKAIIYEKERERERERALFIGTLGHGHGHGQVREKKTLAETFSDFWSSEKETLRPCARKEESNLWKRPSRTLGPAKRNFQRNFGPWPGARKERPESGRDLPELLDQVVVLARAWKMDSVELNTHVTTMKLDGFFMSRGRK